MIANISKVPADVTDALGDGRPLPDARLDVLETFTTVMVGTSGLPTAADLDAFLAVGFSEVDVLQVLLAVAVKTISNYSTHLFHTEVDRAFASRAWKG